MELLGGEPEVSAPVRPLSGERTGQSSQLLLNPIKPRVFREKSAIEHRFQTLAHLLQSYPAAAWRTGRRMQDMNLRWRLERLLTMHDVRHAIHAPREESACRHDTAEDER